jgi:hypothetical protein
VTIRRGLDRWIDLLTTYNTRHGTTSNYGATANLHNSQITRAPAKPFSVCCVFTVRSLATASNSRDSSASRAQVLLSQPPVQNSHQCPQLPPANCQQSPLDLDWHCLQHFGSNHIENAVSIVVAQQYLNCCLRIRCRRSVFTEPMPRNCSGISVHLAAIA